jgi:N-acyl-D-amino-acid deacylase
VTVDELVLRGGMLIDGTGASPRRADVAVAGGRIVAVGDGARDSVAGARELDASGHVVSPGFVDIHTHYDAQVFWDPWLTPSAFHGVTTVIAGNCGFSIAPIRSETVPLLARTLQHVEDMSFETLSAGVPWDEFETFPQYLDAVERRGMALNYGCYVGHTAVRLYEMGDDAYERAATGDELARMQATVRDAMDAGAMGFASSASPTHNGDRGRPVPSRVSDTGELRFLLQPLRDAGRGVVALLPGGVIKHPEVFALQREIGRPFTWTALLTVRGYPYHEKVVAELDAAWAEGAEVWPQVSCRPLVFQMNLAEPFTLNMRPSFAKLMGSTRDERLAAYRDPAWRSDAWEELSGGIPFNWGALTVANDDPDGIAWLLPRDHVLLGLADSGAHVSQLCDACFATDLLGNWVREREVMPLERAVHKLTGEPAAVYGLAGRGSIEVGKAADICVFDPDTVAPGPLRRLRDFPAGGERLTADAPVGVRHVLVNGVVIREDGEAMPAALDSKPGRLLRSTDAG